MEMKEMAYLPIDLSNNPEILHEGNYNGFNYLIISLGSHPCVYIEIPRRNRLYGKKYDCKKLSKIIIHGGITFADFLALNSDKESRWYIGWDYGHLTDFNSLYVAMADGKKWTTQEIFNDVKKVINQISKSPNKH